MLLKHKPHNLCSIFERFISQQKTFLCFLPRRQKSLDRAMNIKPFNYQTF